MKLDTSSTNAMHWAENLVATAKENNFTLEQILDEGWLVGWFANYWAAVHDPLQYRIETICKALDSIERIGAEVDEPEGARYIQLSDTLVKQLCQLHK